MALFVVVQWFSYQVCSVFSSDGFFSSSQPSKFGLPFENQAVFLAQEMSLQIEVQKAKSWSSVTFLLSDTASNGYTGCSMGDLATGIQELCSSANVLIQSYAIIILYQQ